MKRPETRLIHTRKTRLEQKTVNPPVERASTVLFDDTDKLYGPKPTYGRMGLTVHRELEAALGALEHAEHVRLASNGLQACGLGIASCVTAGDHLLFSDSVYGPTRRFCEERLNAMGVEATAFDPRVGADISDLIRDNTAAILLESPGSLTFEIMDTPAIVDVAKSKKILTIMDNTWGAGLHHQPLDLGVDVSIQALTKYVVGHADAFGGAVMTNDAALADRIARVSEDWGIGLAPDDAYLCLRGLRTLHTRLKAHEAAGLELATWLAERPEVSEVLHPALPTHADHEIWNRDFSGANGLFGFVMEEAGSEAVDALLGALELFDMGFSWGGFESLLIPCDRQLVRREDDWTASRAGPLMRIHVGLEAVADLTADLARGFAAMKDAAGG